MCSARGEKGELMRKKKSIWKRLAAAALAVVATVAAAFVVQAADFNDPFDQDGESTGSTGSGTITAGCAITSPYRNSLVGFRFTLVEEDGSAEYGLVDVYNSDSGFSSLRAFGEGQQFGKTAWINKKSSFKQGSLKSGYIKDFETTVYSDNITGGSSLPFGIGYGSNSALSSLASDLETWKSTDANVNAILANMVYADSEYAITEIDDMSTTQCIVIEPIFAWRSAISSDGSYYWQAMTTAEFAIYEYNITGSWVVGSGWNDIYSKNTAHSNYREDYAGTIRNIQAYSNLIFPRLLHTSGANINWSSPADIIAERADVDTSDVQSGEMFDNGDMLTTGLGAAVLSKTDITGNQTNTLTVQYYSNYADKSFSSPTNAVSATTNVLVRTATFKSDTAYPDGLHNYVATSAGTYLGRDYYTATGNWGTSTSGGNLVSQDTGFTTGADLAAALGVDLSTGNKTV